MTKNNIIRIKILNNRYTIWIAKLILMAHQTQTNDILSDTSISILQNKLKRVAIIKSNHIFWALFLDVSFLCFI